MKRIIILIALILCVAGIVWADDAGIGEISKISLIEITNPTAEVIFNISDKGMITGEKGRYIGQLNEYELNAMTDIFLNYWILEKKIEKLDDKKNPN